jgi:cytosine/adenosine deaminase-related metal-dependent hydrolase
MRDVSYDLLVRGGRVVDPANGIDKVADLAIQAGQVVEIGQELDQSKASQVLDAAGQWVFPGTIDTQVHLASGHGGLVGHKMLARAGVTTALDLAGPIEGFLKHAAEDGAGLTAACIDLLVPADDASDEERARLSGRNAGRAEVGQAIETALSGGAIGIKMHVDARLTPGTTQTVIEEANARQAYVAIHCGSTETDSDITGLRETMELVGPNRLHIAHVNSYCRGYVADSVVEAQEAISLLRSAPQLFSESYIAAINGAGGYCENGVPVGRRVRETWLPGGGYPGTQQGLRQAIMDGYARVPTLRGDQIVPLVGEEGVAVWEAAGTRTGLNFPVNPLAARVLLATSKDEQGRFDIDAIATDGGSSPRNVLVDAGLALVGLDGLTLYDWVLKVAITPAKVLGLKSKGHLGPGADADVIVVDPATNKVRTTIANGQVVMHQGVVFGSGTRVITTPAGEAAVRESGNTPVVVNVAEMGFYTGDGLKA